jgi:hypothetical protein
MSKAKLASFLFIVAFTLIMVYFLMLDPMADSKKASATAPVAPQEQPAAIPDPSPAQP